MNDAVIIRDGQCVERDGWLEVSAEVDNERLWFQVPIGTSVSMRAEPFVAAALLEAMYRGVPIHVEDDLPLSPLLHKNIAELQAVYHCWNAELLPIEVTARLEEPASDAKIVASCYSGGVDSALTLVRRRDELDAIVLVLGFDIDRPGEECEERIARHQQFATAMNKRLIPVKTNAREFCISRKISWDFGHGLFLSSLAPLLACHIFYVPSSHTYDQEYPWGSHPLTDPMWSTAANKVVHCGAGYTRTRKTLVISSEKQVLDNIQVCRRSNHYNCGACPKCVRTMVALYLLEAQSVMLPELCDMKLLSWLKPHGDSGLVFLEELMMLSKERGNKKIYRKLGFYRKCYLLGNLVPMLDRMVMGGFFRRTYRAICKPAWLNERVMLQSKDQFDV